MKRPLFNQNYFVGANTEMMKSNICEICHNYYKDQSRENNYMKKHFIPRVDTLLSLLDTAWNPLLPGYARVKKTIKKPRNLSK